MSTYKLYYFDACGLGEPIRLLFAHANVKFEDVRFARGAEWLKLKPDMPWNVVPVLEVDGQRISQSRAIFRFLARRFGLSPQDELQAAKCDEYIDAIVDLRTEAKKFHREQNPEKKAELKDTFIADHFLPFLRKLTEILRTGSGYLVDSKLSYADIFIAYTLEQICSWLDIPEALVNYPDTSDHIRMVMTQPGIEEWVKTRPKTKN